MQSNNSRLFFALWPDTRVRKRLEDVARRLPPHQGRLSHPMDWHATLVFLGRVADHALPCVQGVADGLRSDAFRMSIDRLAYWRRPRILWCGPTGTPETLLRLVCDLQQGLRTCGFKPEARPYTPHVTLARKVRPVAEQILPEPVLWEVREFVLAGSQPGAKPPRYQVLKRWKLGR